MTNTPHEERRLRSPTTLDVDTLRACVDGALRLIGEDAEEKYGPALQRHWARPDWEQVVAREPGKPLISRTDPGFWLREMQRSGSPARSTPSLQRPHSAFVPRLRDAVRARNHHCHFSGIDVDRTLDRLVVLNRAADQLRLRCADDIRHTIAAIHQLRDGSIPTPPTLAEAERLANENRELVARREESERGLARAMEDRDRALDDIVNLKAQLEASTAATQEAERLRQELQSARAHAERLQQDAEIAAAHQSEIEQDRLQKEAAQVLPAQYPAVVREVLGHMFAFSMAAMTVHADTEVLVEGVAGEPLGLMEGLGMLADLLEDLGAPREHADDLPGTLEGARDWMLDHLRAVGALAETSAWTDALDGLDPDSSAALSRLDEVIRRQAELLEKADVFLGKLSASPEGFTPAIAREIEGSDPIEPGESWPFTAGEDTWVLSARDRALRRPGRRQGRLGDLIGAEAETVLVDAFLVLRPEGGRVFIDTDGDVSTYIEEELIYLGQIPHV